MRPNPLLAKKAIESIKELFSNLEQFARDEGVIT